VRVAGRSASLAAPLAAVRAEPLIVYPEKGRDIRGFVLSVTSNMGTKRDAGRGSFADGVVTAAESFYELVLQKLRSWKAAPPQLRKPPDTEEVIEEVAELVGVEPAQIANIGDESQPGTIEDGRETPEGSSG
jgi:hypothetical protein